MERCNGCLYMAVEDWPRGVKVCRCMSPADPVGSIRHFGRVLELFSLGTVGPVMRPKWCPSSDETHSVSSVFLSNAKVKPLHLRKRRSAERRRE